MHINIICVGKLKSGSERLLVDDYSGRFNKIGSRIGFNPINEIEVATGNIDEEANRLVSKTPGDTVVFRLDEKGDSYSSVEFAELLNSWRDTGKSNLTFLIGGASGFGKAAVEFAPWALSFGKATWPHRLVRVMLAEQLYRAGTISLGLPYHKP